MVRRHVGRPGPGSAFLIDYIPFPLDLDERLVLTDADMVRKRQVLEERYREARPLVVNFPPDEYASGPCRRRAWVHPHQRRRLRRAMPVQPLRRRQRAEQAAGAGSGLAVLHALHGEVARLPDRAASACCSRPPTAWPTSPARPGPSRPIARRPAGKLASRPTLSACEPAREASFRVQPPYAPAGGCSG